MDSEDQLRSASDQVLGTIEKLQALEIEKRSIPPTNRRFHKLAGEVEQLADHLADKAQVQADLGEQIAEQHEAAGNVGASIDDMVRDVSTILSEWRAAERRTQTAESGSAEAVAAHADVQRLRVEYQRAQESASQRDGRSG